MSGWTHAICAACWNAQRPDAATAKEWTGDVERCCWCGLPTTSGVYRRADPKSTPCSGRVGHEWGSDEEGGR